MKEMTLAEFAAHLDGLALGMPVLEAEMLEAAGVIVERSAKEKIGEYQGQSGPFAPWEELAQSTKQGRTRLGFPENEPGLRTGEMRESIEHVVVPPEVVIGSNDDNLVYFELGIEKQPPRSVLGAALFEKTPEILAVIGKGTEAYLAGVNS